jgi:predicted MFS family arabinose efflux permease
VWRVLAWAVVGLAAVAVAAFCGWVMQDDRRARSAHRAELRVIARQQHRSTGIPEAGPETPDDTGEQGQRAA